MELSRLNPEFRLAVACCRWPHSDERANCVRRSAKSVLDWPKFLRIVKKQRIEGLVHDALRRSRIEVPSEVDAEISQAAVAVSRRNLLLLTEAVRIKEELDSCRIPALFFKGATLAIMAYGTLSVKRACDVDVLVAPEDFWRAGSLLERSGYVRMAPSPSFRDDQLLLYSKYRKEGSWVNSATGSVIDLHHSVSNSSFFLRGLSVRSPSQPVLIAPGMSLPTFAKDELFAYLCVHGTGHGWSRLKWLADLAALLAENSEAETRRLYVRSQELGAGLCAGQALLLCSSFFGTHLPDVLARELNADPKVVRLQTATLKIIASGAAPGSENRALWQSFMAKLRMHSHYRYRLELVARFWFHPGDRARFPLPAQLGFTYHLLRIPLAAFRWIRRAVTWHAGKS